MSNGTSVHSSRASSPTSSPIDGGIRKRVGKACDRCRMKKSKCDGASPCGKCKADNSICAYGKRKRSAIDKVYPRGYVEMLEHQQSQLVLGLQELYRRSMQHGQDGEPASPKTFTETVPNTHDLLSWLGALDQDKQDASDNFYEDFHTMQAVAVLENPGLVKRETSFESVGTEPEVDQILDSDSANLRELDYTNSFPSYITQTALIDSPQPLPLKSRSPTTAPTSTEPTQIFSQVSWQPEPNDFQVLDFETYDSWVYDPDTQAMYDAQTIAYQQPAETSINPYLTLKDWSILDTYQTDKGFLYT